MSQYSAGPRKGPENVLGPTSKTVLLTVPDTISDEARVAREAVLRKLTKPLLQVLAGRVGYTHTSKTLKAELVDGILRAEGYGVSDGKGRGADMYRRRVRKFTKGSLRQRCQDAGAKWLAKLNKDQLVEMYIRIYPDAGASGGAAAASQQQPAHRRSIPGLNAAGEDRASNAGGSRGEELAAQPLDHDTWRRRRDSNHWHLRTKRTSSLG